MVNDQQPKRQPKTFRAYVFNRVSYATAAAIVAGAGGLAYFKFPSRPLSPPPVMARGARLVLPPGAILIPADDGHCRMHALDNATGQIMDYGVVECSKASNENTEVWSRAMNTGKFVEIGKSFRHEGDR